MDPPNTDTTPAPQKIDPVVDFVAGTVAGMAALAVGFPFDTVKVRFQNPDIASRYRSTLHAFATIFRQERIRGLYRGIGAPLVGAAPLNGLVFSSYRFLMHAQLADGQATPTLTQITLAGAGSGIIASLITTPGELIKIHQQSLVRSTSTSTAPISDLAVVRHIFRTHGLRGFYRGITATALRDTGYGAYFAAYEATLRLWPAPVYPHDPDVAPPLAEAEDRAHSWAAMLTAGGLAGVAGWLFTFPLDVVKTRMQAGSGSTAYHSTWATARESYRAEGASVFFRGLAPTLVRAIPVNMVTFATFEAVVTLLS